MRKERYITEIKNKSGKSWKVRIRTDEIDVVKTFNEKDSPSAKIAFESAVKYRDKTMYEIVQGNIQKTTGATVQDMFDFAMESYPYSFETKRKHKLLFNKYISHKTKRMQELTRADIVEDLNNMVEEASDNTIAHVLSIWKNDIIITALSKDIIYRDLTLGIRKPESHLIATPRTNEVDKATVDKVKDLILNSIQNHYNAHIACYLIDVLYYTGMRPAEAEALTKSDIRDGYIFVTKELGSSRDDQVTVRRCKTKDSVRSIPIHPELKPILDELMDYAEEEQLFLRWDGQYMTSGWIGNIITRLCKANGIKFNLYRLRHNMATTLVTNNVDQKTTIELLGHANYDMSLYYAASNDELKEKAITLVS